MNTGYFNLVEVFFPVFLKEIPINSSVMWRKPFLTASREISLLVTLNTLCNPRRSYEIRIKINFLGSSHSKLTKINK